MVGIAVPGPHLDDDVRSSTCSSREGVEPPLLGVRPVGDPAEVAEHEDVGAGDRAAGGAARDAARPHRGLIDRDLLPVGPDRSVQPAHALEVVDRAVDLEDPLLVEARLLELAVHVGGDDEALERGAARSTRGAWRSPRAGRSRR